jgi:hypothetical protein
MKMRTILTPVVMLLAVVACKTTSEENDSGLRDDLASRAASPKFPPLKLGLGDHERMDIARLRQIAFERCQAPYQEQDIKEVPFLDPPVKRDANGDAILDPNTGFPQSAGPRDVGLVFQEENSIGGANFIDNSIYYFSARPRAADTKRTMEMYKADAPGGDYTRQTWDELFRRDITVDGKTMKNFEFLYKERPGNFPIVPPIDTNQLLSPQFAHARTLAELVIGHVSPEGGFPTLFSIRSGAYVRFASYPPMVQGASLRMGAHRIFGKQDIEGGGDGKEDFPVVHAIFAALRPDNVHANVMALVENKKFCGAVDMEFDAGADTGMVVDGYWYARDKFVAAEDGHTAFIAFSSMMLRNEDQDDTPEIKDDEAHDSDFLLVNYKGEAGKGDFHKIATKPRPEDKSPAEETLDDKLSIVDFPLGGGDREPSEWSLLQTDRCPEHFAFFPRTNSIAAKDNYDKRASYRVELMESTRPDAAFAGRVPLRTGVRIYQFRPDGEFGDNIVAMSNLKDDIAVAPNAEQFVRFKYKVTAFYPPLPKDCSKAH